MTNNLNHSITNLFFILCTSVGLDQTSKRLAEHLLQDESYSFFFDSFRLGLYKNQGAFLSFGANFSDSFKFWLFLLLPLLFVLATLGMVFWSKSLNYWQRLMLTLVASGGVGNIIDRLFLDGKVTDFLNIGIGNIRTGIFNIADVAIMAGAFGLLLFNFNKKTSI